MKKALGKSGEQAKFYEQANKADPKHVGALVNLATLDYENGLFDQAAIKFLDALLVNPEDDEVLANLGMTLRKTKFSDYAKLAFEEAINSNPGNTFILMNYMLYLL